ncbi:hypothetical protein, conserved [Trypanosoma brucei gambiense DAL972]|uniref:Vacuolar import/degradation Vid27 C-terminal domain-containing protein n=2 Tax=Trypanosoma brucei TaxID=5691 RepID=C9ZUK3_TRYB9|nr:hypothetical protein, conserved [Trypanosoma brucei gambiense DAL972]RHW70911.1 VID27 cytoplasmic protein [Trypanosoma brucei equiperdum]CBH13091.1 hypothetical protein, conserved [Trypanosoma brucei gambiense DAL972]|eukprot:XP_011775368.1 hypothetical protein, conserved [Trypanosoma brucei gambiense DAL972]
MSFHKLFSSNNRSTRRELFSGSGLLYVKSDDCFVPIIEGKRMGSFSLILYENRSEQLPYSFVLVDEEEGEVLKQSLGSGLSLAHCYRECSVHWLSLVDGTFQNLAFKFVDLESGGSGEIVTRKFVEMYNRCTYSMLTQTPLDVSTAQDPIYEYIGQTSTYVAPEDDYSEPTYHLDLDRERVKATGSGNVCYSESMKHNRIVVVRETQNEVQLQAHSYDANGFEGRKPETIDLKSVQTCDGALIDDLERKLLLFSVEDSHLREVDLERGEVVQQFRTPVNLQRVTYSEHVARPEPIYTCLAKDVAFNVDLRIDPRKNVIVEDGMSLADYKLGSLRKPFTCHATSANGYLVIGDGTGSVRLYTGPPGSRRKDGSHNPKTAKTLLETKVPIVDIDVTANGQYVVAVCEKFLLLMRTACGNDGEKNGFTSRMGQDKPSPLRLQPTPAQLSALGGIEALKFTSGGFDRYEGNGEVCITACSGAYLFTWSLEAAKRAEETGRTCLSQAAAVQQEVINAGAKIANRIVYQTDKDIRMAPLVREEFRETGLRHFGWRSTSE